MYLIKPLSFAASFPRGSYPNRRETSSSVATNKSIQNQDTFTFGAKTRSRPRNQRGLHPATNQAKFPFFTDPNFQPKFSDGAIRNAFDGQLTIEETLVLRNKVGLRLRYAQKDEQLKEKQREIAYQRYFEFLKIFRALPDHLKVSVSQGIQSNKQGRFVNSLDDCNARDWEEHKIVQEEATRLQQTKKPQNTSSTDKSYKIEDWNEEDKMFYTGKPDPTVF